MAYVVGLLTEEEEQTLKTRGWELEPAPAELVPTDPPTLAPDDYKCRFKMVWVDAGMFDIMSGPDWEKGSLPSRPSST